MTAREETLRPAQMAAAFLDTARRRTGALLVEGEAGIGKTTLAEKVVASARADGFRVLGSRASRPETSLSYAALGDLLRTVTDEELDDVPPPQREALEAALLRRTAPEAMQDARAVSLATLAAVRRVASEGPVLIAVDDLQWLDASSARVVAFVLQRLDAEPVGVLATHRTGETGVPLDLDRTMGPQRVSRLELGPMARAQFGQLLRSSTGPELPHSVVTQIYDLVEGNPFYGQQVAREVLRRGIPEPGEPPPLDPDTFGVVQRRFEALPGPVRSVLVPLALTSRATVDLLRRAAPGAQVDGALARAEDEGLVVIRRGLVTFTHPIFTSAVTSTATATELRSVHRRLAEVLENAEEKGRHLALCSIEPDERTAEALDLASQSARRRGAAPAAAELALMAFQHTPDHAATARWDRAVVAGMLAFEAGDAARAHAMLTETLASIEPGTPRAEVMIALCEISWQDTTEVEALACGAIAEPGVRGEVVASAHLMLAWVWVYRGDLLRAEREVEAARELLTGSAEPDLRSDLLTIAALVAFLGGRAYDALIEEAVVLERQVDPAGPADSSTIYSGARVTRGLMKLWSGDLAGARCGLEEELARFETLGRYVARDEVLCYLAHLECRAGHWDGAARLVDECLDIGEESGHLRGRGQNIVPRAWAGALRGDLVAARRDAEEGLDLSERFHDRLAVASSHGVLGFVELSAGDPERALPHLRRACDFLVRSGTSEPGTVPFVGDALEALVATGRLDEAQALVDDDRLMGRAAHGPVPAALAVRGSAALCAARGDLTGAAASLDAVLAEGVLDALPFELARTLLVAGEVERRARHRQEARCHLDEARRRFAELGAVLWEERAAAELARVVAGHTAVLSATESQVAALVAEGLTNREVADRVFLSVKTVEANLSRIYRKLGLRSRADLVRRVLVDAAIPQPRVPERGSRVSPDAG